VCGIVGYIGLREAAPIIVDGLKKLEYRGYDSFGVATIDKSIEMDKHQGRISDLSGSAAFLKGKVGIGHTRWATHGVPNDVNAHPHMDCSGHIAVVHNGIIENYAELKRQLISRGHTFLSETDTEVAAHLIEESYESEKDLLAAVQKVVPMLTGSFALLVIATGEDRIIAARYASPLVLGVGDGEFFAASDMTPVIDYTERAIFLEDGDIASISFEKAEIFHKGEPVNRPLELIDWSGEDTKKGGFPHYMLKEIYEQPQAFYNSVRSVTGETLPDPVRNAESVTIIACGSSYNAGFIFKYLLEDTCAIPVRLEFASEFKYFPPPIRGLIIGISQSGETADTISALKEAKVHNCPTLAITNVLGSSISRTADFTLFMRAGPEISVQPRNLSLPNLQY
jgi:glucosamine--fructose-6-phosphate aminotransferase (isomerizing)